MKRLVATCIIGLFLLSSHAANAEEKSGGWLKDKIQARMAAKAAEGGNVGTFDEEDSGTCADRAKEVNDMMTGFMGKRALDTSADLKDVAYGDKALQKMDIFLPKVTAANTLAPIIMMVHGGGWCVGDKALKSVTENKSKRWLPKGFIFISVNYPMLTDGSNALEQADDLARAIAYVQKHAEVWGGDSERVILMGHSAGAHLVSLVNADEEIRARFGVQKILGTVSLDNGATNVVTQMPEVYPQLKIRYQEAFGTTEAEWIEASPYHQLGKTAAPWLGVCSTTRKDDPCGQARQYAEKSNALGIYASVLALPKGHRSINADLGKDRDFTIAVEEFMASLDPVVKGLLATP